MGGGGFYVKGPFVLGALRSGRVVMQFVNRTIRTISLQMTRMQLDRAASAAFAAEVLFSRYFSILTGSEQARATRVPVPSQSPWKAIWPCAVGWRYMAAAPRMRLVAARTASLCSPNLDLAKA